MIAIASFAGQSACCLIAPSARYRKSSCPFAQMGHSFRSSGRRKGASKQRFRLVIASQRHICQRQEVRQESL